jgi:co-chaperonin GroES (HSP10)
MRADQKMISRIKGKSLRPLKNGVIVSNMNFGERKLASGIIMMSDDGKSSGVRPRWGKVWEIGPEQQDVVKGEWILMEHGRWGRAFDLELEGQDPIRLWRADPEAILAVSDESPKDYGDTNPEAVI